MTRPEELLVVSEPALSQNGDPVVERLRLGGEPQFVRISTAGGMLHVAGGSNRCGS